MAACLALVQEQGKAVAGGGRLPDARVGERVAGDATTLLRVLAPEPVEEGPAEPALSVVNPASPWKSDRFANRVRSRHATVHAMLEAGHSRRSIGRQLHMTHRTVKSLADAARPEDLFTGQYQFNRASALDEYKSYLDERWNEGCTNAWKLWEEVVPLGYKGSYGIVSAYIRKKRTSPRPVTAHVPVPGTTTVCSSSASKTSSINRAAMRGALGRITSTSLWRPAFRSAAGEP